MRLARFPNIAGAVPSTSDWAKITSVQNHTLKIGGVTPTKLAAWAAEIKAGRQVFAHGLWDWNWADSHRPLSSIDAAAGTVTVGDDDINRDVNPIKTGHGSAQGKDTMPCVYFWPRCLVHRVVQLSPSFLPVPSLDSTRELTAHLALAAVHMQGATSTFITFRASWTLPESTLLTASSRPSASSRLQPPPTAAAAAMTTHRQVSPRGRGRFTSPGSIRWR